MAYKSILTVATSAEKIGATLQAAAALCLHHVAHLSVMALGVDRMQVGYAYVGSSAGLLQTDLEQVEDKALAVEVAVRASLAAEPESLRWDLETAVTQSGALTEVIARAARFADLVVLAKPYDVHSGPEGEAIVEAALFDGHALVLVLPDTGLPSLPIGNVVIAWNQSRQALVAIRRAMPFLRAAKSVNIAVIDPPNHGTERSDPGGALCQMLLRHGVSAEVSVLTRSLPRIADVLNQHVQDQNAGLLVMGAYGHSRLREAVMGGATRSMLEQMTIPVLMSH